MTQQVSPVAPACGSPLWPNLPTWNSRTTRPIIWVNTQPPLPGGRGSNHEGDHNQTICPDIFIFNEQGTW